MTPEQEQKVIRLVHRYEEAHKTANEIEAKWRECEETTNALRRHLNEATRLEAQALSDLKSAMDGEPTSDELRERAS